MLLIVHHSQFGGTAQLAQAAEDGARSVGAIENTSVICDITFCASDPW